MTTPSETAASFTYCPAGRVCRTRARVSRSGIGALYVSNASSATWRNADRRFGAARQHRSVITAGLCKLPPVAPWRCYVPGRERRLGARLPRTVGTIRMLSIAPIAPAAPMPPKATAPRSTTDPTSASLGFEAKLWQAADKLRSNMDAAEYKHVVLGLIFLKYISDAFEEKHAELEPSRPRAPTPRTRDEYSARERLLGAAEARWAHLQAQAPSSRRSAQLVDDAMVAIERENPTLKGVLPKDYARPALDKQRLGELIDLIGTIGARRRGEHRPADVLGRVYEYFLGAVRQRRRASTAASSTRRGGRAGCWSRCSSRTRAASTTRAAARAGCSCSREQFVEAHGGRTGDICDLRAGVEPHDLAPGAR